MALGSLEASRGMMTSQIRTKVAELSGATIPDYAIYQALRALVRRGEVKPSRRGREYSYRLISEEQASTALRTLVRDTSPGTPIAESGFHATQLLHKLAPGEVVILDIDATHVETATNMHGQLVLERHLRPK